MCPRSSRWGKRSPSCGSGVREFILRGDVIDLAVGIVLGAAFGAIVTSFVGDVLTPLLGIIGVADFSTATVRVGSADVRWGAFVNALLSFLLIAAAIFFVVVKPVNRLNEARKTEPEVGTETKECTECLSSIPNGARRCAFCGSPQTV